MPRPTHTSPTRPQPDELGLERLIFFSDAVFAIAITLLVLDIHLPELAEPVSAAQLQQALYGLWPQYLAFVLNFLVIGSIWMGHHRKMGFIRRYDRRFMLINLLFLLAVAFTPFPTGVLSTHTGYVPTIFYAGCIVVVGLLATMLWIYATHAGLVDPALSSRDIRLEILRSSVVPVVFLLSIPLAFLDENLAKLSWTLVLVILVGSSMLRQPAPVHPK